MLPILFEADVAGMHVAAPAYLTFLVLAAAAALVVGVAGARRAGFPARAVAILYVCAIVGGLVGARLLHAALDPSAYADGSDVVLALAPRGFALYGGLGAATAIVLAGVAILEWRAGGRGQPEGSGPAAAGKDPGRTFGRLADSAVPAVVVGIVLLRIGCFLNGCCAGVATDLPVGVVFPAGPSAASSVLGIESAAAPVHATQLYELAAAVLCGVCALWAARATPRVGSVPGAAALIFTTGFLVFRAWNQALRTPDLAGDGALLPAAYLAGSLVVAVLLVAVLDRGGVAQRRVAPVGSGARSQGASRRDRVSGR